MAGDAGGPQAERVGEDKAQGIRLLLASLGYGSPSGDVPVYNDGPLRSDSASKKPSPDSVYQRRIPATFGELNWIRSGR